MNKKMDLHSRLGNIAKRDEYLAESQGISREQARELIKQSTFAEYVNMTEANADRGFVGQQTTASGMDGDTLDADPAMRTPRKPASAEKEVDLDSALNDLDNPSDRNDLQRIRDKMDTDPEQAKQDLADIAQKKPDLAKQLGIDTNDKSTLASFFGNMKQGFMQGLAKNMQSESVEPQDMELARIRELAGLTESATAGSTMSGNIAAGPSIVGDTSDSHKPSVKLRRDNRLDREEKEKEKRKRDKQKRKEDEQEESEIERLIKR